MSTRKTAARTTAANRRGRTNPSHEKTRPVAEWEAEVRAKRNGPKRSDMSRKVQVRGVREIAVPQLLLKVLGSLRRGYEVRLTDGTEGAVRLYACLDADFSRMFVASATMGAFRNAIADIPFRVKHRGNALDPTVARELKREKARQIREEVACVTPDLMTTCPRCGYTYRVGRKLTGEG